MKVLLTGAFGNVGENTLVALLEKKYDVTCFDIQNKRNEKKAIELSKDLGKFDIKWGNITNFNNVKEIVKDFDCIIHLAAIIPPLSEENPELSQAVNVGGMKNFINAMMELEKKPRFIFTSSISTHGPRMHTAPPRKADEVLNPTDNYTRQKVACEKMIRDTTPDGLPWIIFRLGAALPVLASMSIDMEAGKVLFDMPLDQRIEFIASRDVGTALTNAVTADAVHKTLLIGGGKRCQMLNREFIKKMLDTYGIGMIDELAFKVPKNDDEWYYTDWMDTEESQRLLQYQNTSYDEYLEQLRKKIGFKRNFIRLIAPMARWYLRKLSPYYEENKLNQRHFT